ncbi:hypothetical protein [Amycolatopsis cynarae]
MDGTEHPGAAERELAHLILQALEDEELRQALDEELIGEDEIRELAVADGVIPARLRDERETFLRDPEQTMVVTTEIARPGRREMGVLTIALGVVLGYHLLLFGAWPAMPLWPALLGLAGYAAVVLTAGRWAHRRVLPLRQAVDLVVSGSAARLWQSFAVDGIVLPELRRIVRTERDPHYGTELTFRGVRDLYSEQTGTAPVITAGRAQLWHAVARSDTGAIALAGHRGVGKTTALRHVASGVLGEPRGPGPLTVIASAPARYDARDFVLYLHALLCKEVLHRVAGEGGEAGERRPAFARVTGPVRQRERARHALRRALGHASAIAVVALLGMWSWGGPAAFAAGLRRLLAGLPSSAWEEVPLLSAGRIGVLAAGALVALGLARDLVLLGVFVLRRLLGRRAGGSRPPADLRLRELQAVATRELRHIRFLQTFTTGWSGKFALPFQNEAGWTSSSQSAEQQLTYPEVVDQFRAFAEFAAEVLTRAEVAQRLIVAIDELDKIASPEHAQELVNDIKGIFDVRGCLFLVSVSDDAIIAFERRGIPARDAFDSAFTEMIRLENFTAEESWTWISRRILALPVQFCALCHCLSGGLPRDLGRYTVALLDVARDFDRPTLGPVTTALLRQDLARKAHAFRGAAATLESSRARSALIARIIAIPSFPGMDELAALAADLIGEVGDPALDALRHQVASYLLFCATVGQVFTDELTRDGLDGVPGGEVSLLALARRQLAADPGVSWELLEKFRVARGLSDR